MFVDPRLISLIKEFESGPNGGFARVQYFCPAGKQTIGWGHVIRPLERIETPIDAMKAETLLMQDLERFGKAVDGLVTVTITQAMRSALIAFAFNVGIPALSGSTLLKRLNEGHYDLAANEFLRWNKATDPKTGKKVVLKGLTRRRKAEQHLFMMDGIPRSRSAGIV